MKKYFSTKWIVTFCLLLVAGIWFGDEAAAGGVGLAILGGPGIDWDGFAKDRGNESDIKELATDITEFFQEPAKKKLEARKFTVTDGNLAGAVPVVDVSVQKSLVDFGYEEIFAPVDMTKSSSKTFDLLDLTNGVVFEQLKEGEKPKVRKVSSGKASVSYLGFGAALGFLDDWFRFNEYYKMDDILVQVRNEYYDSKAKLHYDLFVALGAGINQAFATDDATTIDNACVQILSDSKKKGYFSSENEPFIVLANPGLKRRLTKAIWPFSVNSNDATSAGPTHNIKSLVTTWHIPTGTYYVILPGNKLKRGNWEDLNAEGQRDALRRAEDIAWHTKYNGAIGDSQQVRRCSLS